MTDSSNSKNYDESNGIDINAVIGGICLIVLIVAGFYFYNFHFGLSAENGNWGTFGDYIGGILNPVIAGFAFYLIAKSYELQKRELEATRSLLEVSTEAQKQQIKLAALTALLNSNLMRIDMLKLEEASSLKALNLSDEQLLNLPQVNLDAPNPSKQELESDFLSAFEVESELRKLNSIKEIQGKIKVLMSNCNELEQKIRAFGV